MPQTGLSGQILSAFRNPGGPSRRPRNQNFSPTIQRLASGIPSHPSPTRKRVNFSNSQMDQLNPTELKQQIKQLEQEKQ